MTRMKEGKNNEFMSMCNKKSSALAHVWSSSPNNNNHNQLIEHHRLRVYLLKLHLN